jgi:hypothetical protein
MSEQPQPHSQTPQVGGEATRQPVQGRRQGSPQGVSGPKDDLAQIAEALLTDGQKGRLLTEAIIAAGYARDPQALRAAYQRNQAAIDDYLAQIDTTSLVDGADLSGSGTQGAALGFAGGAALSYLLQQLTS